MPLTNPDRYDSILLSRFTYQDFILACYLRLSIPLKRDEPLGVRNVVTTLERGGSGLGEI